jgi:protein-disulfide isomerase
VLLFYALNASSFNKEKEVKKTALLIFLSVILLSVVSCAKPDYKKVTQDFIKTSGVIKDYSIRGVEETESRDWKAVIVYAKQGRTNIPIVFLVSRDGRSVVPSARVYVNNKPVFTKRLEPELGRIDFKLTGEDRIVYNPAGENSVYMFSDPDCPFCKKARENLKNYRGEYRVIVKQFPLEPIHPGATRKAVAEQAEWLRNSRKDITKEAQRLREAERIVEEDIAEGRRAEIQGVPTYVMEDGSLKQGLF